MIAKSQIGNLTSIIPSCCTKVVHDLNKWKDMNEELNALIQNGTGACPMFIYRKFHQL